MKFKYITLSMAIVAGAFTFSSCSNDEPDAPAVDPVAPAGLYIINEGNFQASNSSLSFYDPTDGTVTNNLFRTANDVTLGDLAYSMTIHDDLGWVVVNNSGVVFAIDLETNKEKGRITNLTSPRFMHFISDTKAYITQLYDNRIAIVNPSTYSITGYIDVPGMDASSGSTEMMVQVGKYVYVNCWSYQNSIIRINTETDRVDGSLTVNIQPKSIVLDRDNNIWALTDGGYYGSPYGHEAPHLMKIDTRNMTVALNLEMNLNDYTPILAINGAGDQLYWICNDVYTMPVTSTSLPDEPIIDSEGHYYYGMTVSPDDSNIYIADAVDYVQTGKIHRYDAQGNFVSSFSVGVNPRGFCWRK